VTFLAVARAVPDSATDIPPELLPGVIGGDLAVLLVFSMLVTGAVLWRRNREAHLRLMLLASVAMVGTAVSRLPGALALLPFSILAVQIGIPVALMINDRLRLGRVHRATIFGTAVLVAGVAAGVAVGLTGPGQRAILEWLG
jgi:hypothetical protein